MYKALIVMTALLACLAPVFGVGYAPLGVLGTVTDGGAPVEGALITLKGFIDGSEVAASRTVTTNSEGMFYNVLTIMDGDVIDVQVTIEAGAVYVELLEGAAGWNDYEVALELQTEEFIQKVTATIDAPSDPSFDTDLQRLEEGDVDQELLDKYGAEVVPNEAPLGPVIEEPAVTEEPSYVPAPQEPKDAAWWVLRVSTILMLIGCLWFIRYEIKRHERK